MKIEEYNKMSAEERDKVVKQAIKNIEKFPENLDDMTKGFLKYNG